MQKSGSARQSDVKVCSLPMDDGACSDEVPGRGLLQTFQDVVRHYLQYCAPVQEEYLRFYREQPSLADAIKTAAFAEMRTGGRFARQRRVPHKTLVRLRNGLVRRAFENVRTFDELHEVVRGAADRIPGVGELTTYETTQRLGAFLGLRPKYIYLHAGSREGADALGVGADKTRLHLSELPEAFRQLMPEQAEDCLCIYKNELVRIASDLRQQLAA